MVSELEVWDSTGEHSPEMVLRYCASSARVNKFSLHRQTRKEERNPYMRKATASSCAPSSRQVWNQPEINPVSETGQPLVDPRAAP